MPDDSDDRRLVNPYAVRRSDRDRRTATAATAVAVGAAGLVLGASGVAAAEPLAPLDDRDVSVPDVDRRAAVEAAEVPHQRAVDGPDPGRLVELDADPAGGSGTVRHSGDAPHPYPTSSPDGSPLPVATVMRLERQEVPRLVPSRAGRDRDGGSTVAAPVPAPAPVVVADEPPTGPTPTVPRTPTGALRVVPVDERPSTGSTDPVSASTPVAPGAVRGGTGGTPSAAGWDPARGRPAAGSRAVDTGDRDARRQVSAMAAAGGERAAVDARVDRSGASAPSRDGEVREAGGAADGVGTAPTGEQVGDRSQVEDRGDGAPTEALSAPRARSRAGHPAVTATSTSDPRDTADLDAEQGSVYHYLTGDPRGRRQLEDLLETEREVGSTAEWLEFLRTVAVKLRRAAIDSRVTDVEEMYPTYSPEEVARIEAQTQRYAPGSSWSEGHWERVNREALANRASADEHVGFSSPELSCYAVWCGDGTARVLPRGVDIGDGHGMLIDTGSIAQDAEDAGGTRWGLIHTHPPSDADGAVEPQSGLSSEDIVAAGNINRTAARVDGPPCDMVSVDLLTCTTTALLAEDRGGGRTVLGSLAQLLRPSLTSRVHVLGTPGVPIPDLVTVGNGNGLRARELDRPAGTVVAPDGADARTFRPIERRHRQRQQVDEATRRRQQAELELFDLRLRASGRGVQLDPPLQVRLAANQRRRPTVTDTDESAASHGAGSDEPGRSAREGPATDTATADGPGRAGSGARGGSEGAGGGRDVVPDLRRASQDELRDQILPGGRRTRTPVPDPAVEPGSPPQARPPAEFDPNVAGRDDLPPAASPTATGTTGFPERAAGLDELIHPNGAGPRFTTPIDPQDPASDSPAARVGSVLAGSADQGRGTTGGGTTATPAATDPTVHALAPTPPARAVVEPALVTDGYAISPALAPDPTTAVGGAGAVVSTPEPGMRGEPLAVSLEQPDPTMVQAGRLPAYNEDGDIEGYVNGDAEVRQIEGRINIPYLGSVAGALVDPVPAAGVGQLAPVL